MHILQFKRNVRPRGLNDQNWNEKRIGIVGLSLQLCALRVLIGTEELQQETVE